MDAPLLSDPPLALAPFRVEHVGPRYLGWLADEEVMRFTEARFAPVGQDEGEAYVAAAIAAPSAILWRIVVDEHQHIGNLRLSWVPDHRRGAIALIIGEKGEWGRGHARRCIALAADFALSRLGLRKLTAGAYASNRASLRCFEAAGFVEEARLKDHFTLADGSACDGVLLARFAASVALSQ